MTGVCEFVNPLKDMPPLDEYEIPSRTYSILRRGETGTDFENLIMIPIEKAGFVVIRQKI